MARLTIGDLRRIVDSARAGGISTRSVADIMTEAKKIVSAKRAFRP